MALKYQLQATYANFKERCAVIHFLKGVKRKCIIASLLMNFYTNSLVQAVFKNEFQSANKPCYLAFSKPGAQSFYT